MQEVYYFSLDKEAGDGLPWFGLVQSYLKGSWLQELINSGKRFSDRTYASLSD